MKYNEKPETFAVRFERLLTRYPQIAELDDLISEVLAAAVEVAGADMGAMYRFDEKNDCLRMVASDGFPDGLVKFFTVVRRGTDSSCAAAFAQKTRVAVDDVSTSDLLRGTTALEVLRKLDIAAEHSTPIVGASDRLWGVITTYFHIPQSGNSYDPSQLDCLAKELANCFDRLASQFATWEALQTETPARQQKSYRLAGMALSCPCHACAFFTSKEEEYRVMLPFMAEGFESGDLLVHIIDPKHRNERLSQLTEVGIDTERAEQSGQLQVLPWEQAHIVGGRFDQHRMLADLDSQAASNAERFATTRLWSNQEWALEGFAGAEDIFEYEARFNYIWPKTQGIYVCVYDAKKFNAETMAQMLRAHPFVIIDGVIRESEFYVPPDEFLKQLRG